MSIRSCQFIPFYSSVSIHGFQFLHVKSFMSVDSCQFIHFMHFISFQFASFQFTMNSFKPCPARAGHRLVWHTGSVYNVGLKWGNVFKKTICYRINLLSNRLGFHSVMAKNRSRGRPSRRPQALRRWKPWKMAHFASKLGCSKRQINATRIGKSR